VGTDVARVMRAVAVLIVPIAAILMVNGVSVSILLFGNGAASPEQAGLMGLIVAVFMLGLLPFTLFYVLLRGYYALEDTRTPFFVTVIFSVLLLLLVYPLFGLAPPGGRQVAAIALAYSLAYWVGFGITWLILARRLGSMQSARTAWLIVRTLLAGVISAAVMLAVLVWVLRTSAESSGADRMTLLISIAVTSIVGLAAFLGAAWALRITEVSDVVSMAGRLARRGRRA
jgi:putative peptidoglycan lipid II flippase